MSGESKTKTCLRCPHLYIVIVTLSLISKVCCVSTAIRAPRYAYLNLYSTDSSMHTLYTLSKGCCHKSDLGVYTSGPVTQGPFVH